MRYIYRLISQWMDEREKKLMGKCQPEWRRDPLRSSFPDQLFGFFSKDSCLLNYSRGGRWHCKTIGPQVKNQAKSNILQINFCTWGGGPGTILTVRAPPGVMLSYKDQGLGKSGKEGKALGNVEALELGPGHLKAVLVWLNDPMGVVGIRKRAEDKILL